VGSSAQLSLAQFRSREGPSPPPLHILTHPSYFLIHNPDRAPHRHTSSLSSITYFPPSSPGWIRGAGFCRMQQ